MTERVPAGFARFSAAVAALPAGVVGRTLLVACAFACGLLLLDALLDALAWVLTRDRRAAEDAANSLAGGAALLALTAGGVRWREELRQALAAGRAREVIGTAPWGTGPARDGRDKG